MSKGYVYVLSNKSTPGIVKIGHSKHGGEARAKSFYQGNTGLPTPYDLEYEMYDDNAAVLERCVHMDLVDVRVNPKREFFRCLVGVAINSIISNAKYRNANPSAEMWPDCISISGSWAWFNASVNKKLEEDGYFPVTQVEYARAAHKLVGRTDKLREELAIVENPDAKKEIENRRLRSAAALRDLLKSMEDKSAFLGGDS